MTSTSDIVRAVRSVVGEGPVKLHEPFITKADMQAVAGCDPLGYDRITRFEEEIAGYTGRRFAIGVSSGTAALHLAALALGVRYGVTVECPPITFAGAIAAITYTGATPTFGGQADVVMGLHLVGIPNPMCLRRGWDIEDAAPALGSKIGERMCGSFGKVSTLSFNHNKIIAAGGGGMVLCDDPEIAKTIRHIATTAKVPSPWFFEHDAIGYNYRMSNMQAALGLSQLGRIDETIERKRATAARYAEVWKALEVPHLADPPGCVGNAWMNMIFVAPHQRQELFEALQAEGVESRALYRPPFFLAPYRGCPVHVSEEEFVLLNRFDQCAVCLPSGRINHESNRNLN